jgi:hypothetical protein
MSEASVATVASGEVGERVATHLRREFGALPVGDLDDEVPSDLVHATPELLGRSIEERGDDSGFDLAACEHTDGVERVGAGSGVLSTGIAADHASTCLSAVTSISIFMR